MMEYCIQCEGEQTRKGIDKDSEPSFFFQSSGSPASSGGTPRSFEEDPKNCAFRAEQESSTFSLHAVDLTDSFTSSGHCYAVTAAHAPSAIRSQRGSLYYSKSFCM